MAETPLSPITTSHDDLEASPPRQQQTLEQELLDTQIKLSESESKLEESQRTLQQSKVRVGVLRDTRTKLRMENSELLDANAKLESEKKSINVTYSNFFDEYLKLIESNAALQEEHTILKNEGADGEQSVVTTASTSSEDECMLSNTTMEKEMRMQIRSLENEVRDKETERVEVLHDLTEKFSTEWQVLYDLYVKVRAEQVKLTEANVAFQQEQDRLNEELKMEQSNSENIQRELDWTIGSIQDSEDMHVMIQDRTVAELDAVKIERDGIARMYGNVTEESKSKDATIDMYVKNCDCMEWEMLRVMKERDDAIGLKKAAEQHVEYLKNVDYYDDDMQQLLLQAVNRNDNKKRKYQS
jgi:intracellular sulfur oxidation DsrE/DsrF family protein